MVRFLFYCCVRAMNARNLYLFKYDLLDAHKKLLRRLVEDIPGTCGTVCYNYLKMAITLRLFSLRSERSNMGNKPICDCTILFINIQTYYIEGRNY